LTTLLAWVLLSSALGVGFRRLEDGAVAVLLTIVFLVAGVGCLVTACVAVVRATRRWRRLVLLPWVVALLVGVYSLSIALAATFPPHPAPAAGPAGAESVSMIAADGTRLSGWFLPGTNGAAVALRHGAGSTAGATTAHAQVLHEAGFGVLATDARGHGGSDGRGMDFGWFGEDDIRAAVDHLSARSDVDPERIGVVGLSMGAEEAIGAAGMDPRIRSVVAEGATGRTAGDKDWLPEEYGFAGTVQQGLDAMTYAIIGVLTPADRPATLARSVRASSSARFLLVAAGTVPDEQHVADRLAAIGPGRVRTWTVERAEHVGALSADPAGWTTRVVNFLNETLTPPR